MVNHAMMIKKVEITVAPYLAGTVNHAMMDETAKITDYINLTCELATLYSFETWTTKDREERLRTKTVQRLTPPSFVHMIVIC